MKYDCDLIQDIVSLYKDKVLSNKSEAIVDEHLSECEKCKSYYDEYSDAPVPDLPIASETEKEVAFIKKIREYRLWQTGVFGISLIYLLTMVLPWFGHTGITEITGTATLRHPTAIIGIGLLFFAIWYNYRKIKTRQIVGYIGWGLVLATVIYDLFTLPMGSVIGIQIGPFGFSIPYFPNFSITKSFEYALVGFYIGIIMLLAVIFAFSLFVRRCKTTK